MLLILMLTSKGMAGVPRASMVVIAATLNQFNIPEAGLILLMGVDPFLDMGRFRDKRHEQRNGRCDGESVGRRTFRRGLSG